MGVHYAVKFPDRTALIADLLLQFPYGVDERAEHGSWNDNIHELTMNRLLQLAFGLSYNLVDVSHGVILAPRHSRSLPARQQV